MKYFKMQLAMTLVLALTMIFATNFSEDGNSMALEQRERVHIGDYSLTELIMAVAVANDLHRTTSMQDKSIE